MPRPPPVIKRVGVVELTFGFYGILRKSEVVGVTSRGNEVAAAIVDLDAKKVIRPRMKERPMKAIMPREPTQPAPSARPAVDLQLPETLETATFALG